MSNVPYGTRATALDSGRIEGSHDRSEMMALDQQPKVLSGETVRNPREELAVPLLVLTRSGTSGI